MDTKKLAGTARALIANGMAKTLEEAVITVVRSELTDRGGSTARQESLWIQDVLRVARAAEQDGRALNGGAGRGQGRIGDVVEQAAKLERLTARQANLEAMSADQLAVAFTSVEAAARSLQAERIRRTR